MGKTQLISYKALPIKKESHLQEKNNILRFEHWDNNIHSQKQEEFSNPTKEQRQVLL